MTAGQDEWRQRVEARSTQVMRRLGGWLVGAFAVLVGVFFALGAVNALTVKTVEGGRELDTSGLPTGLFLAGAAVFTVAGGLFCVFTGYAPRASYTSGRPDPSYGRIRFVQAWRGMRGWLRGILVGLAGLGVLIAAGGAVVSLVSG